MPPVVNKDHEDDLVVDLTAESDKKTDKNVKKDAGKKKKKKKGDDLIQDPDAMSEEDKELKERLETCVSTVLNTSNDATVTIPLRRRALDMMATELRSATSSMTSVPKPLKFLRPFYQDIKKLHEIIVIPPPSDINHIDLLLLRAKLADVLSVLAMTMGKPQARESLSFKLLGMSDYKILLAEGKLTEDIEDPSANLGSWGHEFVRSLAGEIGQEYNARVLKGDVDPDDDAVFEDLLGMVDVIVPFHVKHNAEAEAVDLLIEVQRLKKLIDLDAIDESNYRRICLYLLKTADFMSDPEDLSVRSVLRDFYRLNTLMAQNISADSRHPSICCPDFLYFLHRKCLTLPCVFFGIRRSTMMRYGLRCALDPMRIPLFLSYLRKRQMICLCRNRWAFCWQSIGLVTDTNFLMQMMSCSN